MTFPASTLIFRFTLLFGLTWLGSSASIRAAPHDDSITCRVVVVDTLVQNAPGPVEGDGDEEFFCILANDSVRYSLDLPQDFVDAHADVVNGRSFVEITNGRPVWEPESMQPPMILIPPNATITMVELSPNENHRQLATFSSRVHGNKTVLILHFAAPDGTVGLTMEQQSARTFGIGDDLPSRTVNSQYNDCSYGKLNIVPAQGSGVVNGVATINLNFNVSNVDTAYLEVVAAQLAEASLGIENLDDAADHIIVVYPDGTKRKGSFNWVAYADIGGKRSFYNDHVAASSMTIVMHELGHNFGLWHSGYRGHQYRDTSGLMGFSYSGIDRPYKCFNGHKNYLLGWYDDKVINVDVTEGAWTGNLAGITSYHTARPQDYMIAVVGNLYLSFNRSNKFNTLVTGWPDRITIVRGTSPNTVSWLEGVVSLINSFDPERYPTIHRVTDFNGGFDLVVEACDKEYLSRVSDDLPDVTRISIHLDDGIQSSLCDQPLPPPPPTASPTPAPTVPPSSEPSVAPTMTEVPTTAPSAWPSVSPSEPPSTSPSASPTSNCSGVDYPGLVPVSYAKGSRTCSWIRAHRSWRTYLCRPEYEAFELCRETCDTCNQVREIPKTSDACEDTRGMVHINERVGYMRCFWFGQFLKRSPHWRSELCATGTNPYYECPETCGACTDTCEDQMNSTFYIDRSHGRQDCAWLESRPYWRAKLCRNGTDAFRFCKETCSSCP